MAFAPPLLSHDEPYQERGVLRIARIDDSGSGVITLKVEGRLVADSVGVVEQECRRTLQEASRVRLDFSEVTFIDGRGLGMLRRLRTPRLEIVNCSPFIEDLLSGAEDR